MLNEFLFLTSEVSQEEKMVYTMSGSGLYEPRKIGALVAIQGARTLQNIFPQDSSRCRYFRRIAD